MARKTVWRAVGEALVGEGADRVFGLPGNPIHLAHDLEKHSGILPRAPPAWEMLRAENEAWTSPAALNPALTDIGLGRVQ